MRIDYEAFQSKINYFAGNPPLILPGGVFAGDARCNRTEDEQLVALVKKRNLT